MIGILQNEDIPTFDAMIKFLLEVYPHLETARTISLVDGDQANINSIQRLLRGSRIMTCLYHINENVKTYIIPWLKKKTQVIDVEPEDVFPDDESHRW